MDRTSDAAIVEAVVHARKTEKVLGDVDTITPIPDDVAARHRVTVLRAIETAGWAPFHYPRNVDGIAEPWRAHVLWHGQAQRAARHMRDALQAKTKEPSLAAGCHALVLVTWLPEFRDAEARSASSLPPDRQSQRDDEHLAATGAMVQNLLLVLTAHGMGTYWSSGGQLRGPAMAGYLGIPENERLLAAVFVAYPEVPVEDAQRIPGAHREKRSGAWIREVTLVD